MASTVVKSLTAEHRAFLLSLPGWSATHGADHLRWPEEDVARALCQHLDITLLDPFDEVWADERLYRQWGQECHRLRVLPLWRNGLLWSVAMEEPWNLGLYPEIMGLFRCQIVTCGILTHDLDRVLSTFRARWEAEPAPVVVKDAQIFRPRGFWPIDAARRDRFEVLVKTILTECISMGASDVLFEPKDDCMQIRACINENFQNMPPLDLVYRDECLVALKNFASVDTNVMDGFLSTSANIRMPNNSLVNLRIECQSVQLTGSKSQAFAFRPQDSARVAKGKMPLPFEEPILSQVRYYLSKKQGMILTTGPTGSGKTTTLHACLAALDAVKMNIRTIEDPVEYLIPAYGQTPVGKAASKEGNLSFEGGLHSNLRFHPHVLLVGEIRDAVVARTAFESALTGHLIFSTLHTDDALGAIGRLRNIGGQGVDPSVLAQTLRVILAQRMIRLLCPNCRRALEVPELVREHFQFYDLEVPSLMHEATGCAHCKKSGYAGKKPIFEAVFFDQGIKNLVAKGADRLSMQKYWLEEQRAMPLGKTAMRLVQQGLASYEDVAGYDNLFEPASFRPKR